MSHPAIRSQFTVRARNILFRRASRASRVGRCFHRRENDSYREREEGGEAGEDDDDSHERRICM